MARSRAGSLTLCRPCWPCQVRNKQIAAAGVSLLDPVTVQFARSRLAGYVVLSAGQLPPLSRSACSYHHNAAHAPPRLQRLVVDEETATLRPAATHARMIQRDMRERQVDLQVATMPSHA